MVRIKLPTCPPLNAMIQKSGLCILNCGYFSTSIRALVSRARTILFPCVREGKVGHNVCWETTGATYVGMKMHRRLHAAN